MRYEHTEQGFEIPYEQLNPDTLRNVISEFVTREWDESGEGGCTLDEKIGHVMVQIRLNKAKLVFDPASNTCNIVVAM